MADAINAIVSYPALYHQLREDGLAEVAQITWDKAGKKVIDIYNKVLNR
jgi:glycosyltransferase involved in cell wall biosynthesis